MEKLTGKKIYNGIAIGKVLFFAKSEERVTRMHVEDAEAELEQIKLESAMLEQENYLSEEQIAGGEGNEV